VLTEPDGWRSELLGALKRLDLDTLKQRRDELNEKQKEVGLSGLSIDEKNELRGIEPSIRELERQALPE
jgi:hypothetical protein